MIVGFIGFGDVASTISENLIRNGCEIVSSSIGRSLKTKKLIEKLKVKDLNNFKEVAKNCDILISANTPSKAISIGKKYGSITDNILLDLNNISPTSTKKIGNMVGGNFVDGAIIGKISSNSSIIILSGEKAEKIAILNDYGLNIKIISDKLGDASKLKMLRSIYTKGVSTLLIESFEIAEQMDLEKELLNILTISEGDNFKDSSKSRIENSIKHSRRKYEEVEEIIDFLDEFENVNIELIESMKYTYNKLY
ncbi:MAG: NAD(P)-binding domain-containing protein [Methanobrevibacter sp.]|nr:NAD(P)-binding domain-containing protein [Candidatus Methanovirga basalitermitum]